MNLAKVLQYQRHFIYESRYQGLGQITAGRKCIQTREHFRTFGELNMYFQVQF